MTDKPLQSAVNLSAEQPQTWEPGLQAAGANEGNSLWGNWFNPYDEGQANQQVVLKSSSLMTMIKRSQIQIEVADIL